MSPEPGTVVIAPPVVSKFISIISDSLLVFQFLTKLYKVANSCTNNPSSLFAYPSNCALNSVIWCLFIFSDILVDDEPTNAIVYTNSESSIIPY